MATRRVARSARAADPDDYREDEDQEGGAEPEPRSRRSRRDRDEEPEEEAPRRKRARAPEPDEDDEEEAPRRSKRAKPRDDDDEDDEPRTKVKTYKGYAGAKRAVEDRPSKDYPKEIKFEEGKQFVLKFLDDEPFTSYGEHWVQRSGQQSFTCSGDDDCPLCAIGDRTSIKSMWNVVLLDENEEPALRLLKLASRATEQLAALNANRRTGPLTKAYWEAERTGTFKGRNIAYQFSLIKEDDLEEDYDIEPLTDKELDSFDKKVYTEETSIPVSSRKMMKDIAAEALSDD